MHEKACLLLAGRGTRMGPYSDWIHKSLLPVGGRAILSRIIDSFPRGTPFVFAVHHLKEQVMDFMAVAHPEIPVEFVFVSTIDGPGAGPGRSLLECQEHLGEPFYVVCGDLLFGRLPATLSHDESWLSVPKATIQPGPRWCNVRLDEAGHVIQIADKQDVQGANWHPFCGLAKVGHPKDFFFALNEKAKSNWSGEIQLSAGFQNLIGQNLTGKYIDWIDTGNIEDYLAVKDRFGQPQFEKHGELLYFEDNRVVKFFSDPQIAKARFTRADLLKEFTPKCLTYKGSFFSYEYREGSTLASLTDPKIWNLCLQTMADRLWIPAPIDQEALTNLCRTFYVTKTYQRVENLNSHLDSSLTPEPLRKKISEQALDPANVESAFLLARRNFRPARIHGDFQPDNIIFNKMGEFSLIDWRHDFAGSATVGDVAWDLAKFNLYLQVNLSDKVSLGQFRERSPHSYQPTFRTFARRMGFELEGLDALSALALIQMAGLHVGAVAAELYLLGFNWLKDILKAQHKNVA